MSQNIFAAVCAAALVGATSLMSNGASCDAADRYSSAPSSSYSLSGKAPVSISGRTSFKYRILAKYDANDNGRLDGKERLAARAEISRYRAQKGKIVYAQQRYRQAVRTAQTAYVQAAMRQPTTYLLAPSYRSTSTNTGHCKDSRYGTVNFRTPAMKRASRPPPSVSSPGLIYIPATKKKHCTSSHGR